MAFFPRQSSRKSETVGDFDLILVDMAIAVEHSIEFLDQDRRTSLGASRGTIFPCPADLLGILEYLPMLDDPASDAEIPEGVLLDKAVGTFGTRRLVDHHRDMLAFAKIERQLIRRPDVPFATASVHAVHQLLDRLLEFFLLLLQYLIPNFLRPVVPGVLPIFVTPQKKSCN